jgi:hypothetical protein
MFAQCHFGQKNNQMHFMTIKDIEAGEEICDNYIDITLPKKDRQKHLKEQYGFNCQCQRCNDRNIKLYDEESIKIEYQRKKEFGFTKSKLLYNVESGNYLSHRGKTGSL